MRVGLIGLWNRIVCYFLGHASIPLCWDDYGPLIEPTWTYYCQRCGKHPLPTGYDLI